MAKPSNVSDFYMGYFVKTDTVFRPITQFAKCVALYSQQFTDNEKRSRFRKMIYWIQFLMVYLLLWLMPIKYIMVLLNEQHNPGRLIPILAIFTFHLGTAFISTATYFTFAKNYKLFSDKMDLHQRHYGPLNKMKYMSKHNKIGIFVCVTMSLIDASCYCLMIPAIMDKQLANLMYPLRVDDTKNSVITYGIIFCNHFFVLVHMFFLLQMSVGLACLFSSEFSQLTVNIKTFIDEKTDNKIDLEQKMENARQNHTSLIACLDSANSMVSHYMFGFYATSIPVLCFVLYGIIRGLLTNAESMLAVFLALTNLASVAIYTVAGAVVSVKAHGPLDILTKVNLLSVSERTTQSVSLFVSRLSGPTIGFSIYELFTLDPSTILALIGTLVTYIVVMLQFQGTSQTSDMSHNITCV